MTGGFYMVQRAPEHELHYRLGEEIETWETVGDLVEKVEHYLAHPDQAAAIAARGRARAQRDHTWDVRFRSLFEHMGCLGELKVHGRSRNQ